jgi:hypothetical protein
MLRAVATAIPEISGNKKGGLSPRNLRQRIWLPSAANLKLRSALPQAGHSKSVMGSPNFKPAAQIDHQLKLL